MSTTRVKTFFHYRHTELDSELGRWLESQRGQIVVTDIAIDSNDFGHSLVVLYLTAPGPVYAGRVWFHRRHDGLEQEVNAALTEERSPEGQFVALGSNQQGHVLCVIGAYA